MSVGSAQRPGVQQLFQPDIFRRETEFFGVHQLYFRLLAGGDHPIGLGQVETEGFLHNDVLAGRGGIQSNLAMQGIGNPDHDHIDVRLRQKLPIIREGAGNLELRGKGLDVRFLRRGGGGDSRMSATPQGLGVDAGDELGTDKADLNRLLHNELLRGGLRVGGEVVRITVAKQGGVSMEPEKRGREVTGDLL